MLTVALSVSLLLVGCSGGNEDLEQETNSLEVEDNADNLDVEDEIEDEAGNEVEDEVEDEAGNEEDDSEDVIEIEDDSNESDNLAPSFEDEEDCDC